MKKMYWKKALVLLLVTVSLSGLGGCQKDKKSVSAVPDGPPGTITADGSRIVASMGTVSLSHKQVINYLQSLDSGTVTGALGKEGGLEQLTRGVALRQNVVTRAVNEGWLGRADVKLKVAEVQRNVLYSEYISAKTEPPAGYPDDAIVAKVYATTNQQQKASGKAALKPLRDIKSVLQLRLREKKQQANEKKYFSDLASNNPFTVNLKKLIGYIKLSPEQKKQQVKILKQPVARMGTMGVSLELVLKSLGSLERAQQRALLRDATKSTQYIRNLATKYFVLNEAIAAKFNARPEVRNNMEQARMQLVYSLYMKAWSTPKSDFPSAVLVKENYQKNLKNLIMKDRYHLAKILIKNSGNSSADGVKANKLASAARTRGTDFGALARKYSQEPQTAKVGGDVGWVNTAALLPELSRVIRGNGAGAVVGPVHGKSGWQVIKILGHQAARQQTLEEARPALVVALRKKRTAEKKQEVIQQLVASEPITIDKKALQKLRKQISS